MTVRLGAGTAEMNVQNLALDDYGTLANALGPNWQTAFDPATVSFDVVWSSPVTRRLNFQDATNVDQFGGEFVQNQVTVTWSGTNLATGFTFTSNPGTFATSSVDGGFAELGHEQNGTFFQGDSSTQQVNSAAAMFATQASSGQALPGAKPALQPVVGVRAQGGKDLTYHGYVSFGDGQSLAPSVNASTNHSAEKIAAVRAARDRVFELASGAAESWTMPFTDIGP